MVLDRASTLMQKINFPVFFDPNGVLTVFDGTGKIGVPFPIARIFTVVADGGSIRGKHAHYRCSQLLVCLSGQILVRCFDGMNTEEVQLEGNGQGILIPPGIWASQEYQKDNSMLMALCDRGYEEEDYIRDYQIFIKYKSGDI